MPKKAEKFAVNLTVEQMADRLVAAKIQEEGVKRPFAQRDVAQEAGLAPTAIGNLLRGRLKDVERISGRIKAAYVGFLERQIARLETELAFCRARDPKRDLRAAEASIAAAKAALRGPPN